MSEGMRQGQKEHLGPRGSLWTALGSHGKLRFVCISSELGPTPHQHLSHSQAYSSAQSTSRGLRGPIPPLWGP